MKNNAQICSGIVLLFALLASCKKDENPVGPAADVFNAIPANKYHENDILQGKPFDIYGTWRVASTSGGIHGGGYTPDFDYLLIKPNAIFGIVRGNELITTGKIEVVNDPDYTMLLHFVSDKPASEVNIELVFDFEKYVEIHADTLSLLSPCCDRFDTHLKKM